MLKMLFWMSVFMIFFANVGYPMIILILGKIIKRKNGKDYTYKPTVTLMIVAHNEEKVINEKLKNAINLDYPREKLKILVTSDNSNDNTNNIVRKFINDNENFNIKLYEVKERKGKTNAQNEAAKFVDSEILVMTDANSMLDKNAIKELVSSFTKENISYVTGKLVYTNAKSSVTSNNESTYWNLDTHIRDIESNIQTITAGNGAIYACKTKEYHDFDPIFCHDSAMPVYYALNGKRAIANHDAIAYEKAGECNNDEFKRKVRMNRVIVKGIIPSVKIFNVFKYKWFTFFYLGHRTARYLLWFNHLILFILNILLLSNGIIYVGCFAIQMLVYGLAILKKIFNKKFKIMNFCYYYCMTILAQIVGVWNVITKNNKPFWEKAESTR